MPERRIDALWALGLAALTTIVVGVTAQSLGFTRDEGYYFKAGELYWGWFKDLFTQPAFALSNEGVDKHWQYNHEHPAILKSMFALSFGAREVLGLPIEANDALRFPAWLVAGLSTALVFGLARSLLPRRAAVVAALLWVAMPHVFWHMHLACFDVGVAAAHCALVLAYWRWRHTLKGALLVGVVFGVAAGVKHNVLPVPALLVLHWLLTEARPLAATATATATATVTARMRGLVLPPVPLVFFSLAFVGPMVFLLHWPWLWPDPARRWGAYIGYHLNHEHYPILYFGDLLTAPPFPVHFPFVMSAVTIPVPTLVAMLLGVALAVVVIVRSVRWRAAAPAARARSGMRDEEATLVPLGDVARAPSSSPALLLLINAAYPFILIALPSTPIFGGTKHWMNALPFLCVLAAWAVEETLRRFDVRRSGVVIAVLALALPGAAISARVWPYGLGSYNELIGFTRGAANAGMQRTFWGYEPLAALPAVNAHEPRVKRIHFGDTNNDSYKMYKRDGFLRSDIAFSNTVRGSDVACVQPQGEFKQQWLDVWNEWRDRSPDAVHHADGVPVSTCTFRIAPASRDPRRGPP